MYHLFSNPKLNKPSISLLIFVHISGLALCQFASSYGSQKQEAKAKDSVCISNKKSNHVSLQREKNNS